MPGDDGRRRRDGLHARLDARGLATLIRGIAALFVEVLHPDVNKGNGLVQMCKALGIPIEQGGAFGDGDNDIEFVSKAGLDRATRGLRCSRCGLRDERTNDEDGVAHALHQLEAEAPIELLRRARLGHVTIRTRPAPGCRWW